MAFWKRKSEDPWDIDPNRRREPVSFYEKDPEPEPESSGREEGLLESVREQWTRRRQEKREALVLEPEVCPWCGRNMEQGFLTGGKGVFWVEGIPDTKAKWFGTGFEDTMQVDTEGVFYTYKTAWHCPNCRKMVVDTADLQTRAEESPGSDSRDSFSRWDGNPVAPYSPEKQEDDNHDL